MTDIISQTIGTNPIILENDKDIIDIKITKEISNDDFANLVDDNKKNDYISIRENLIGLINTIDPVVKDIAEEVRNTIDPKLIDPFSNLLKTYIDLNSRLLLINSINENTQNPSTKSAITNNAVFIGTTEDLIDKLKKKKF